MSKFCGNCGRQMSDEQRFCPDCGTESVFNVNMNANTNMDSFGQTYNNNTNMYSYQNTTTNNSVQGNRNTYKMVVGILMIILCACLVIAGVQSYEDNALLTFTIPGVLGTVSSILMFCSKNNHSLLKPAGIIFIVSAGVNFLGIYDISIYAILAVIFGILNIVYCKKK